MNTERPDQDDAEASGGRPENATPAGDSEPAKGSAGLAKNKAEGSAGLAKGGTNDSSDPAKGETAAASAAQNASGGAAADGADGHSTRANGADAVGADADSTADSAVANGVAADGADEDTTRVDSTPANGADAGGAGANGADAESTDPHGAAAVGASADSTATVSAVAGGAGPNGPDADTTRADSAAPFGAGAESTATRSAAANGASADGAGADGAAVDSDGSARSQAGWRRSGVIAAAVVAAVLVVGGGGTYLATAGDGGGGADAGAGGAGGGATPPPLPLDDSSASASSGGNGIAPGEPNPYGVTYRADGKLPDGPGSAAVYRSTGEVGKEDVARLAKALGVDATPVTVGDSWQVGAGKDGSGPVLRVARQAPGSWTFSRYSPGTDNCKKITTCHAQDPAAPAATPVSVADAEKAAAPVLKALGQDDAKVDARQVMGAQRVVNADPVVDGLPTHGWTTGLTVGVGGELVGGSGQLTAPAKGASYPVLSADRALKLMNSAPRTDHRMGIGGCADPVPLKDRFEQPCGAGKSGTPGAPGTSAAAGNSPTVTIERAVFGLAAHSVGGRQALVPSWLFEVRGAQPGAADTVTYPAVDPKYLTSASAPETKSPTSPTSPKPPKPRNAAATGYKADGENLTVTFSGGVCADYTASADEDSDRVTVTVTEKPWPGKVCIMIAKQYERTVHLHGSLGSREVVGPDGQKIPKQAG
ncbi:hypothetical protein [Streptomyces sp. NPDC086787]|uniref:hypothetical protein n=1 Tax=Streptomyces sp. NPDC086787 TaxID=3365759 RepID=UPI003811C9AB